MPWRAGWASLGSIVCLGAASADALTGVAMPRQLLVDMLARG